MDTPKDDDKKQSSSDNAGGSCGSNDRCGKKSCCPGKAALLLVVLLIGGLIGYACGMMCAMKVCRYKMGMGAGGCAKMSQCDSNKACPLTGSKEQ